MDWPKPVVLVLAEVPKGLMEMLQLPHLMQYVLDLAVKCCLKRFKCCLFNQIGTISACFWEPLCVFIATALCGAQRLPAAAGLQHKALAPGLLHARAKNIRRCCIARSENMSGRGRGRWYYKQLYGGRGRGGRGGRGDQGTQLCPTCVSSTLSCAAALLH